MKQIFFIFLLFFIKTFLNKENFIFNIIKSLNKEIVKNYIYIKIKKDKKFKFPVKILKSTYVLYNLYKSLNDITYFYREYKNIKKNDNNQNKLLYLSSLNKKKKEEKEKKEKLEIFFSSFSSFFYFFNFFFTLFKIKGYKIKIRKSVKRIIYLKFFLNEIKSEYQDIKNEYKNFLKKINSFSYFQYEIIFNNFFVFS